MAVERLKPVPAVSSRFAGLIGEYLRERETERERDRERETERERERERERGIGAAYFYLQPLRSHLKKRIF